jgi:hypothetical protein
LKFSTIAGQVGDHKFYDEQVNGLHKQLLTAPTPADPSLRAIQPRRTANNGIARI